jgi:thiol-disulfide isomerase/thioredoxin
MRIAFALALVAGLAAGRAEPADAPAAKITVEEVRGDALDAAIARHKDKVVVVDLWATWCETCVKKFPHFIEMHKKYGDKGLVCISVSMDKLTPTTYKKQAVLDFLQKKGAAFPNYVVLEPELDEKALAKRLGEDYRLIPLMIIYDKAGRKVWSSDEDPPLKDAEIDKKVEDLLSK